MNARHHRPAVMWGLVADLKSKVEAFHGWTAIKKTKSTKAGEEKMKLGKVETGKRRSESNKTFLPRMGTGWDQDGSEAGIFCL